MTNRLADETSLYLRQHADNPVDWRAWNPEALAAARAADRPILLSIGYSACHWCHVMAHESFEDAATGDLMNRLFINVKVDREERPDLDRIYQLAHQALTRRGGGWPLTVFLDPHSLVPFFAGTYFPKTPRHGLPAFAEVLQGVRRWWDQQRDQVNEQNAALQGFLADYGRDGRREGDLTGAPLQQARNAFLAGFDADNGGHRGAPKFPHAGELELLLAWARDGDAAAGAAALTTLERMAGRGLHDHLAGGFFRYCVDDRWDIPHFEKMLYDNALLLPLYAEAAQRFDRADLRAAAEGIVGWLQTEMRADGTGFCSSLDADAEGVEGKYYVWTRDTFAAALDEDLRGLASRHFGLDRDANFEGEAWHLHASRPASALAAEDDGNGDRTAERLERARRQLQAARGKRVRPGRDDKRLTAWNALLAHGLAQAGQALQREDWIDEAAAIVDALNAAMDARGRLPAVLGTDGPGFLDDHAFALQAALSLLRARWSTRALQTATQLAETLLSDFADDDGGFFFTAHDHEALPQRPKPWLDESTPAGNGAAAKGLLELGHLLADPRYLDAAEGTLRAGATAVGEIPQAAAAMLAALSEWLAPTPLVVVRGDDAALARWRAALRASWPAPLHVYAIATSARDLPEALAGKPHAPAGQATLCRGSTCLTSVANVDALLAQLRA